MKKESSYEDLSVFLKDVGIAFDAAEVHGIITGLINGDFYESLQTMLLEIADNGNLAHREGTRKRLIQLHGIVVEQFSDTTEIFQLLLPDDSELIKTRAKALVNWCEGFLYGFGLAAKGRGQNLPASVKEVLVDISEFTRLDIDIDNADQEQGFLLSELEEYLRVAVTHLYQDMHND